MGGGGGGLEGFGGEGGSVWGEKEGGFGGKGREGLGGGLGGRFGRVGVWECLGVAGLEGGTAWGGEGVAWEEGRAAGQIWEGYRGCEGLGLHGEVARELGFGGGVALEGLVEGLHGRVWWRGCMGGFGGGGCMGRFGGGAGVGMEGFGEGVHGRVGGRRGGGCMGGLGFGGLRGFHGRGWLGLLGGGLVVARGVVWLWRGDLDGGSVLVGEGELGWLRINWKGEKEKIFYVYRCGMCPCLDHRPTWCPRCSRTEGMHGKEFSLKV